MRKKLVILWAGMLLLLFCGCNKGQETEELLSADREVFCYSNIEEANCITVDENGMLYTSVYQIEEDTGPVLATEYVYQPSKQLISVYDLEGKCIRQELVAFGNGSCNAMLAQENFLYCVVYHSGYSCPVLFTVDTEVWEVTEVVRLKGYQNVSYLERVGEYFYVLGQYNESFGKEYSDDTAYVYQYQRIGRFNISEEEPQLELMGVELPVAMYKTTRDTLMIYRYVDGIDFGFLEFDQQAVTLQEAGWKKTEKELWNLGGCGDGYLCCQGEYLYYGTVDGSEAQVYPKPVQLNRPVVYKKGFAFFYDLSESSVHRICVADIVQENKPLQFLLCEHAQDLPYGCGFQMEKSIVTNEELALKVLALDSDFDLFLLSSRANVADSIKKNGVFYALNKVEGVEEYLEACFPYLNELARNEEGDIWMVPVMLAIPGVVYNKTYCAENDVDISSMDMADFLDFTAKSKAEYPEYTDISNYVCSEEFFGQYLSRYDTFDTELFRSYAVQIKELSAQEWNFHGTISGAMSYTGYIIPEMEKDYILQTTGKLPEFYYFYNIYSRVLNDLSDNLGMLESAGMLGVPKLEGGIKNCGTLTFLAVNPQSENLEATLDYISAYARYMLTKQDSFLLADESTYTNTPFVKDWYQLYANGTVYFAVDGDVYLSTFNDYLEGKIDLETAIAEMERRRKLYLEE